MEKLYTVSFSSSAQFPIAKFTIKLKKVGKTTRSARHDLNQISFEYAVEVMNRFKQSSEQSA